MRCGGCGGRGRCGAAGTAGAARWVSARMGSGACVVMERLSRCVLEVPTHVGESKSAQDEPQAMRSLEREEKLVAPQPEDPQLLDGSERAVRRE